MPNGRVAPGYVFPSFAVPIIGSTLCKRVLWAVSLETIRKAENNRNIESDFLKKNFDLDKTISRKLSHSGRSVIAQPEF
jgi:hypothetical protein